MGRQEDSKHLMNKVIFFNRCAKVVGVLVLQL
jgi:hypothetical protein